LTADLFETAPDVRPSREAMADGAVLLRGFALPSESDVIAALREIVAVGSRFRKTLAADAAGLS
jgi:alkylated DNA repair protein (DNA oxidative demethylase)